METGMSSSSPPSSTFGAILGDGQADSNGWSEGVNAEFGFGILEPAERAIFT